MLRERSQVPVRRGAGSNLSLPVALTSDVARIQKTALCDLRPMRAARLWQTCARLLRCWSRGDDERRSRLAASALLLLSPPKPYWRLAHHDHDHRRNNKEGHIHSQRHLHYTSAASGKQARHTVLFEDVSPMQSEWAQLFEGGYLACDSQLRGPSSYHLIDVVKG
jgi:hypothetical protein